MNKIICDVCGTVYADSAECCPICGYMQNEYTNEQQEDLLADSPLNNRVLYAESESVSEPEIYSDAQPLSVEYDDDFEDDFEDESNRKASVAPSTIVIILLVVIICLLLLAIGVLFFGVYLPNQKKAAEPTHPQDILIATEPVTEESTDPTIPCASLVLTSGVTELTKEGQYWLLHVTVLPEDTTDVLAFVSENEEVVTVNEHGRLTAVGEGETTVHISCGDKQIKCKVVVKFAEEETIPEESESSFAPDSVEHETLPAEIANQTQPSEEPKQSDAKQEELEATIPEETVPETTPDGDVILKLEKFDVSSTIRGISFELKLACDLKPEDVTWLTMDSKVAIVKNGMVTTIGPGQTKIVAQYKGQQVSCVVRCNF